MNDTHEQGNDEMKNISTAEMNAKILEACQEAAKRFPDMDPKLIGRMVKFAIVTGTALRYCNDTLAEQGKELSEKGVEFVVSETAKLAKL